MSVYAWRAARFFAWTWLESFGRSGLSFVSLVMLSRFLGPPEFGAAAIALGLNVGHRSSVAKTLTASGCLMRAARTSHPAATIPDQRRARAGSWPAARADPFSHRA
jgi:hypothetical protein